jgi:hypothetical protein
MAGTNPTADQHDDNWLGEYADPVPTTVKVLTILTFIASAFGFLGAFYSFAMAPANYQRLVDAQDKIDQLPAIFKAFMGPHPVETARLALENRLPILLITLIGAFLCFYGALYMRKLKKVGFSIYILGDLVPFTIYIFIGTGSITPVGMIFGVVIILVFAILYATQLKYMK